MQYIHQPQNDEIALKTSLILLCMTNQLTILLKNPDRFQNAPNSVETKIEHFFYLLAFGINVPPL